MNRKQKIAIVVGAVVIALLAPASPPQDAGLGPDGEQVPPHEEFAQEAARPSRILGSDHDLEGLPPDAPIFTDLNELLRRFESEGVEAPDGPIDMRFGNGYRRERVEIVEPILVLVDPSAQPQSAAGDEDTLRLALVAAALALTVAAAFVLKDRKPKT